MKAPPLRGNRLPGQAPLVLLVAKIFGQQGAVV
jgi:hypothetical protein